MLLLYYIPMTRRLNIGRLKVPKYVSKIKEKFDSCYPDSIPSEFQIYHTVNFFWDAIEELLIEQDEVDIPNFGKFVKVKKTVQRVGHVDSPKYDQYYPKFKWSSGFVYRFREALGTLTEAQKRHFEKRKMFVAELWRKRKEFMITKQARKSLDTLGFLNEAFPDSVPEVYKEIKRLGLENYSQLQQYYADRGEPNPYEKENNYEDLHALVERKYKEKYGKE